MSEETYKIYGAELSPYSVKVRSYCRYKDIPHEWIVRSQENQSEFERFAKLPLVPLVVTPPDADGERRGLQDSTPILEQLETLFPDPTIHPETEELRFLSALLEEYGDEWGNKGMFHYRWWREVDQQSAARRIAETRVGRSLRDGEAKGQISAVVERMVPRLSFVGSNKKTKDQIEGSLKRQVALLERHLAERPYLFGARPSFGDFGWWAQIYEAWTDPTPRELISSHENVLGWIDRMLSPTMEGDFEEWDTLRPTMLPILEQEVAGLFLPWSHENARALGSGQSAFTVLLEGREFTQETQKYHAKSLGVLFERYAAVSDRSTLDPILEESGCLRWLER